VKRRPRIRKGTLLVYALLVGALAVVLVFGLTSVFQTSSTSAGVARTVTVSRGTVQSTVTASGNLSPATTASVGLSQSGTLTAVDVAIGEKVKAGQALASIDPLQAQQNLASAKASLLSAEENLASAQAGGTTSQLAQAAANLSSAELTLQTDEQQLASDDQSLTTAKTQLAKDKTLGCPAVAATSGSGSAAASAASGGSGSAGSGASGSGSAGSSGSGASGSGASTGSVSAQLRSFVTSSPTPTSDAASATPAASAPSATTQTASSIATTGATLNATVNPGADDTTYSFEYGTTTQYGSSTSSVDAGSGTANVAASAAIGGLRPGTAYVYRVVATNSLGTTDGASQSFTTNSAPTASTGSAGGTTATAVTLTGTVGPGGVDTTYYFQYGTTASYGKRTASLDAGAGTSTVPASTLVTGLKPGTTYTYRLVATSSLGTATGIEETFSTPSRSCTSDATTVTNDEQTIARQKLVIDQQELSITATKSAGAPNAATVAEDQAAVASDQATVAADEKLLQETTLTAPISGTVTAVNGAVGQTVGSSGSGSASSSGGGSSSAGSGTGAASGAGAASSASSSSSSSGFITIDDLGAFQVVAGFAEADAAKVKVGQPVTVTMAALPNTEIAGQVAAVAPTSTVSNNVVEYDVTISLSDPPPSVKDGMTADVSVVVATATDVLEVPSAAITTRGSLSTVTITKDGKQSTQPVTVGIVGSSTTQVVSGLSAGDVLVEPTATISAGTTSGATSTGGGLGGGGGLFGGGAGLGGARAGG